MSNSPLPSESMGHPFFFCVCVYILVHLVETSDDLLVHARLLISAAHSYIIARRARWCAYTYKKYSAAQSVRANSQANSQQLFVRILAPFVLLFHASSR